MSASPDVTHQLARRNDAEINQLFQRFLVQVIIARPGLSHLMRTPDDMRGMVVNLVGESLAGHLDDPSVQRDLTFALFQDAIAEEDAREIYVEVKHIGSDTVMEPISSLGLAGILMVSVPHMGIDFKDREARKGLIIRAPNPQVLRRALKNTLGVLRRA